MGQQQNKGEGTARDSLPPSHKSVEAERIRLTFFAPSSISFAGKSTFRLRDPKVQCQRRKKCCSHNSFPASFFWHGGRPCVHSLLSASVSLFLTLDLRRETAANVFIVSYSIFFFFLLCRWFLNGRPSASVAGTSQLSGSLLLANVSSSFHGGRWTCRAENELGAVVAQVQLSVYGEF